MWPEVETAARSFPAADFVARARLLGLCAAPLAPPASAFTDEQARGLRVGGEVLCEIW